MQATQRTESKTRPTRRTRASDDDDDDDDPRTTLSGTKGAGPRVLDIILDRHLMVVQWRTAACRGQRCAP